MCESHLLSWLNFIVLMATLISVVCYTIITSKLHHTAKNQLGELLKQRRLSIMPTLLPSLDGISSTERFILKNIGNGIALNIQIDNVYYMPKNEDIYYKFDVIPMLAPSDQVSVPYKSIVMGARGNNNGLAHLRDQASSTVIIRFTFSDLAGDGYEQLYQMGKDPYRHVSIKLIS